MTGGEAATFLLLTNPI